MSKPRRTVLILDGSDQKDGTFEHQFEHQFEHHLLQDEAFSYRILTELYNALTPALCRSQQVDGILLNLHSPHSSSLNILGQLKEQMGDRCPPVVVVDDGNVEIAIQAFKYGAADYLIKNQMTPDALRLAMRSAIENAELQRESQCSQEQFQTSVENMLDCFGIFSSMRDESGQIVDFRIDYLNRAAYENNQMPKEMQVGRGLCEVLPGSRESGLFADYCRLVETGEPLVKDSLIYEDPHGGEPRLVRAYDIRAARLNDGFVASWRDITNRKHLELKLSQTVTDLQQQQQRLQRLLDTAPIGIGIGGASGEVRVINDAMLRLHGITRDEFERQGLNWHSLIPPELVEQTKQEMELFREQGFVPPREKTLLRRDGTRVPVWISGTRWMDSIDEHVSFVVDLTQQKQTESALRAIQHRYRELAEAMPQMVWTADAAGVVNYWNQRWYEYTGLSEPESIGLAGASVIHPDERDRTLTQWSQSVASGEPFEAEYRIRRWDGVYHWFISRAIPTRNSQNSITGWIGTSTNINHQKQLEAKLLNEIAIRQRSEQELRRGEEQLKLAQLAANAGYWDWEISTNRVFWSLEFYALCGIEPGIEPSYENWLLSILEEDRARVDQEIRSALVCSKSEVYVEYRVHHPIQGVRWLLAKGQTRFDAVGQPKGMTGFTFDITDRKHAEIVLQQNQERLDLAMEAARMGAWDWDIQTGEINWSANLERLFGMAPGSFNGRFETVMAMIHPDDFPWVEQAIHRAVHGREEYNIMFRFIKPDGTVRWALGLGRVFYSAAGVPIKMTGIDMDITDRKQIEAALRQSEDRLRLALESAQLGTWDWNLTTNELTWDTNCKAMFGVPPEAQTSIEVFFTGLHPDERDRLTQVVQDALNPASGGNYDVEYRTIGIQDGVERWIKAKGQAFFDTAGHPRRFIGTVLDITEQKQAEAERDQLLQQEQAAREEAERANRIKDEFLAVLSHELRSPLNPILGWAKLLQMRKLDDAKTAEALATIERNARLQAQLIDDLLDVAKILRGKLSLNTTSIHLSGVIEAAIETVRTAATAKSISLHFALSDPGQVAGDAARLQQVVWNLLSNAIKFTPTGGRVDIRLDKVGDQAEVTVQDTGEGIAPDFKPHIFESFRQEDASTTRKYGGLGLGLAIVRQLVEAHGGTISADSPGKGQGAIFTICLPLLHSKPESSETDELSEQDLDLTGLRVLVVDDEPDTRDLLAALLTQYGARVLTLASAVEVLASLESFQPDVLVSDIGMPEVDGYTLIKQIRTLPSHKGGDVPAIALTAYAQDEDHQQAIADGYQQHVTKPLEPEKLIQAVAALAQR